MTINSAVRSGSFQTFQFISLIDREGDYVYCHCGFGLIYRPLSYMMVPSGFLPHGIPSTRDSSHLIPPTGFIFFNNITA